MSEEETTTQPERNLVALAKLADFDIREFTLAERRAHHAVNAKHGVQEAQQRLTTRFTENQLDAHTSKLERTQEVVDALRARRAKLLESDDWELDDLTSIDQKLEAAEAELRAVTLEQLPNLFQTKAETDALTEEIYELLELVNMETVREVAIMRGITLPVVDELMEVATTADHDFAHEIVEAGVASSPLERAMARQPLNRAGRRSQRNKKPSSVLN